MGGDLMMKKGTGFSVAPYLVVMLLTTSICRATSSKINDSHSPRCSTDNSEDCLIGGEMELEEFSMESEISRRLLQASSAEAVTDGTGNPDQPAVACGDPRYDACLPNPNAPPANGPNCGIYNRECPR